MNAFERKLQTRLRMNPKYLRSLFLNPSPQTLNILEHSKLLEAPNFYLAGWIKPLLPYWEILACEGNEHLAELLRRLKTARLSPIAEEEKKIYNVLSRQRILASTPGIFPFSPIHIQQHLEQILQGAEVLADLPQFEAVYFSDSELLPLRDPLEQTKISAHSRRYIENLFTEERREAILSILAYLTKNHPLLNISRQAYALMLSLDIRSEWAKHPFCVRLIYNRHWSLRVQEELQKELS